MSRQLRRVVDGFFKKSMLEKMLVWKETTKMEKIILFHGTPDKTVVPIYGKGEEKHDYGRGFYLTDSLDLAKEWAVWVFSTIF